MKMTILAVLLLSPGLALGQGPCAVERTQTLELDTVDISALQIDIGPDSLRLDGHDQEGGALTVRMCASDQERLDALAAALERHGDDRLVLALDHGGRHNVIGRIWFFERNDYGRFEIRGRVPSRLAVDLTVGSGDAEVNNVAALEAVVGSGDLEVSQVSGQLMALVGSGGIEAERTGPVEVGSIGSGDIRLRSVEGDARIGSIGSGRLDVRDISGSVSIGTVGSGRVSARAVSGNVDVRALGSGRIEAQAVGGDLSLRSKGSGNVEHRDVEGRVSVPNR